MAKGVSISTVGLKYVTVDGTKRATSIGATGPYTKGNTVSVREAQTRAHGGVRFEERVTPTERREYFHHTGAYKAILSDYRTTKAEAGTRLSQGSAEYSKEFRQILKDLKSSDNSPTGKKAQALVAIGRRSEEADWDVGETPTEAGGIAA